MKRSMLKSKIHRATVTGADVDYEGSITIDQELMDAARLVEFEQVDIYNIANAQRFSTYVIKGERGKGEICLNGAAAKLVSIGDLLIICSYSLYDEEEVLNHRPVLVYVDEKNRIKETKVVNT
ncbi:MAG: aspartate 1-decarboxylase [Deltaproteobacteria bacterium CG03_land_8_20_14_0_80_45_14]|nr:MAG: aspartate 1-decarboxylase [Deltaproteobacteria bacterium CG03_land_8_20_14_0_80_45_14]